MPNTTVPAAATGLPVILHPQESGPSLVGRHLIANQAAERLAQEAAMNEVLVALTAMLAEAVHD